MVNFVVDGTDIEVRVSTGPLLGRVYFTGKISCTRSWIATLLQDHLTTQMGNTLAQIRQNAYESGWRDAKRKQRRNTWFSRQW